MKKFLIITLVMSVLLGACTLPIPPASEDEPVTSSIERAVIDFLHEEYGIPTDQIKIISIEAVNWPNSCLGVEDPNLLCLEVITPGYKIMVEYNSKMHEIHTDESGKTIVMVEKKEDPEIVRVVKEYFMSKYGSETDNLMTISYESVEWRDSCLGVNEPGKMCMQVITPGYKVILKVEGKIYIFHTNQDGSAVILAPQTSEPVIVSRIKDYMAKELEIDNSEILTISFTSVDWPDGCLGITDENTSCIQVITPGYRVELEYGGNVFTYRSDESGSIIKRELIADPKPGEW